MAKLEIRCPVCSKWENIEILDDATKNVKKGLLAVNIAPGMICDHTFIAYVDKNLTVRDCFIADFKLEAPEAEISHKDDNNTLLEPESIRFDLIKLNIPEKLMISIFKAIFLGEKTILINEDQFLYNQIINFFRFAIQDLFDYDLLIMSEINYEKLKNEYEDYLVFKGSNLIHDKNSVIDFKKLGIEKKIVQKFLKEYDSTTSRIILRNEIQKAFKLSKELAEFISCSQNETFTSKALLDHINEKQAEPIHKDYLSFLLDIVKNYFKVETPIKKGLINFLGN
ncbi:MAG: hypothetical protein ACW98D_12375 [Promethearchaeota archaeon]|jgi:hypothetical protein